MEKRPPVRSLAARLKHSSLRRLISAYAWLDFIFFLGGGLTYYLSVQIRLLGNNWRPVIGQIAVPQGLSWFQGLGASKYHFRFEEREYFYPVGSFRQIFYGLLIAVLIFELFQLLLEYRRLARQTDKLLYSLQEMALSTAALTERSFDEKKYHELEDAIEALKPDGARLQTGDKDLLGLETAINQLLQRTHDSYREQLRFVSDASHELRTPIAVIQGYADLLARWGKRDEKVLDESITALQSEASQMQKLVEQLLFLARGDAGRAVFKAEAVDLADLVCEADEEYRMIEKKRCWRVLVEGPIQVQGDPALLKQLLRILIDNAVKYSDEGSTITLSASLSSSGFPQFSVGDEGIGISKDHLSHVFERFYRADPARSRGGSGLGLSIAKWIADRHKAWLEILSYEGVGTRISCQFPKVSLPEQKQGTAVTTH